MSWPTIPFERLFSQTTKNGLTRPSRVRGNGYKMINMGELFANDRISADVDMDKVPMNERELDTMLVEPGDLIFARQSLVLSGAGKCSIVTSVTEPTTFESHLIRVRLNKIAVRPDFFYYYFKSPACGMRSIVTQGVQAGIRASDLAKLPVHIPPLKTQQAIAETLAAYDDSIENNRQRMALLEKAARQLYCEWFIRLRFPGHEHTRITNGVPEGWQSRVFLDACASLEDGDWIESKDQGGEDFRLLQISNIGINEFVETGNFRFITEQTFKRLNCREILSGQILISRMPKPIGRAWLVTKMPWRMITAVDAAIAIPNEDLADSHFLTQFLNSPASLEHCARRAVGATRARVAKRELATIPLLLPPRQLQKHFRELAEPLNQQRAILYRQNEKLRAARDLLLPKLMSGEIAV